MEERYLTSAQVAERLQVVEKTVQRWMASGELPAVKLGRVWRISEADLNSYLQKRRNTSQ